MSARILYKIGLMQKKPVCRKSTIVASSNLFHIEQMDLEFANGEQRLYERISGKGHGAVMIAPILNNDTILLVREYACGLDRYEVTLPKGLIEANENSLDAANREMQEEVGYAARRLTPLKKMSTAPGHMTSQMQLVLAEDLYPATLEGDEPETIEVIEWRLNDLSALIARDDFTEARSIAAIYIVQDVLKEKLNG